MSFFTRPKARRGVPAALLACLVSGLLIAGCSEDRSNLIPKETADSLIAQLDEAQALADSNKCFEAKEVVLSAQLEIESLGPDVDRELKRSLVEGVTELQNFLSDSEKCLEKETTEEEPTETEEPIEDEGTTGETGTTGPEPTTTGPQGDTDENQEPQNPQGNNGNGNGPGNGNGNQAPPTGNPNPPSNPTTPTTPTNPTTPGGSGPGSGGLGPG